MVGQVGIVVVSHSPSLAQAAVELALEMVVGRRPPIAIAAGAGENVIGTDAVRIAEAIATVASDHGVLVLMDLGSALLSAELALELLEDTSTPVRLSGAPFVEGLLAAVVLAASGASLDEVERGAATALDAKTVQLFGESGPPAVALLAPGPASPAAPVTGVAGVAGDPGGPRRPACASGRSGGRPGRYLRGDRDADQPAHREGANVGAHPDRPGLLGRSILRRDPHRGDRARRAGRRRSRARPARRRLRRGCGCHHVSTDPGRRRRRGLRCQPGTSRRPSPRAAPSGRRARAARRPAAGRSTGRGRPGRGLSVSGCCRPAQP